jgi:LytS/YehU family sensor histidine kinase
MLSSAFLFIDIGFAISAYSMYVIILTDQIEQYQLQQQEIAHQRASITVLKMRPHFIYNTMTSIYYLCAQDPQKAQQVTLDFTSYLRKNFTAVASEQPVPFPEELEHARAYLAVEQAQHEDDLCVAFDTPHTRFRLPPLTLQPIVENSVKHGLDPDAGPLHITIRTRETEAGSIILVEDDGAGFDAVTSSSPHVALKNIQGRLEMMCGGTLEVLLRVEGGTAVRVTIPKE